MTAKVLVPTQNHIRTLNSARLASDVMNVPTIIFWDENFIQTRDNCKKYLKLLYDNGIFYKNAYDAAEFCNNNQKIYEWWNDKERKKKISTFLENFANKNVKKIVKLYSIINHKYEKKKN